jgi:hypothetical protein
MIGLQHPTNMRGMTRADRSAQVLFVFMLLAAGCTQRAVSQSEPLFAANSLHVALLRRTQIVDQDGDGYGDDQLGGVLGVIAPQAQQPCAGLIADETLALVLVEGLPSVRVPLRSPRLSTTDDGSILLAGVTSEALQEIVLSDLATIVAALADGFDGDAHAAQVRELFDQWAPAPFGGDGHVERAEVLGQGFMRALLQPDVVLQGEPLTSFEARLLP